MTQHLFTHSSFFSDLDALSRAVTGPAWEPGKAQIAWLRSLGHKLERFLHAREVVHRRIHQHDSLKALRPWLGTDTPPPAALQGEGTFVSLLLRGGEGFRLGALMLPAELAEKVLTLWRQTDPEAPKVLPPLLPFLSDSTAPLWLALLRLRPLRGAWESALRRDHFETLLQVFPDAWLLDPTPLPPGAVIPGLEISGWNGLSQKPRDAHHEFAIAEAQSLKGARELTAAMPAEAWEGAVQEVMAASAAKPRIVVGLPATPEGWLLAVYEKKGTRVDARGFLSLTKPEGGGWQAAKVR